MIQVGVIGMGTMGYSHAKIYHKMPFVKVAAVCDTNSEILRRAREEFNAETYTDYREMLKNPEIEAVSICMPDNLHVEAVLEAVKCKKHILLEKPIADTIENGCRIYEAVKNSNKVFTVGYNLRYDARYSRVRENVLNGSIGDIVHISSRRNSGIGGPLRFIGHTDLSMHVMVHDINVINWFMKCNPQKVFAKKRDLVLKKYNMTDTILAIITYEDGTIVSMEACWIMNKNWPYAVDDYLEVVGTKGVLYTDGCGEGFKMSTESVNSYPDTRYRPILNGCYAGALGEELQGFLNAVIHNTEPMVTAEEAMIDLRVVEAINRSISSGCEEMV